MLKTLTTARCLAGCGVLAEGGWAETDKTAERHTTRAPQHPTATGTRALAETGTTVSR